MSENKFIYKVLMKIGEAFESAYFFCTEHPTEILWFSLGVLSMLTIQLIF